VAAVTLSVVDDRKPYRGEAEGAVSVIGTGTLSVTLLLLVLLVLVLLLSVDMMIYTDDQVYLDQEDGCVDMDMNGEEEIQEGGRDVLLYPHQIES
jgi:hypothetical protein